MFVCFFIIKNIIKHLQCITTNDSMQLLTGFTENEEIYPFLIYDTNQEQQKEKLGRPESFGGLKSSVRP